MLVRNSGYLSLVVFQYRKNRSTEGKTDSLGGFEGYLQEFR
jgi:hypothetical protein